MFIYIRLATYYYRPWLLLSIFWRRNGLIYWREYCRRGKGCPFTTEYILQEKALHTSSVFVLLAYLAWKSRPLSLCQIEVTFEESRPFFTKFLPKMVLEKDKKWITTLMKVLLIPCIIHEKVWIAKLQFPAKAERMNRWWYRKLLICS